jgi:hypothetical protein
VLEKPGIALNDLKELGLIGDMQTLLEIKVVEVF